MIYKKDGVTYIFASKFKKFNVPYAVSERDKLDIDNKLNYAISFLKNSFVDINDTSIPFFDFSNSPMLRSDRYKAEIWNRVNTMREFASEFGFDCPIFITLTPPSYYKPLKQIIIGKKKNKIKLVDNPKFNGSPNYINDARDYISNLWRSFLRQRIFREIKEKYNSNILYLRTYEPFMDGVPHCHLVCFIPSEYKDRFIRLVKNYFKTSTLVKSDFDDNAGGVVSYVLKYILKSFTNSKNDQISDVAYWYVRYGIYRFSSSRSLIPMYIYRKIKNKEEFRDLKHVTNLYRDGFVSCDLICDPYAFLDKGKVCFDDCIIDTIVISVNGCDVLEHKIAYKRSDKMIIRLADGKTIRLNEMSSDMFKTSMRETFKRYREKRVKELKEHLKFLKGQCEPISSIPFFYRDLRYLSNRNLISYYDHYKNNVVTKRLGLRLRFVIDELLKRGLGFRIGLNEPLHQAINKSGYYGVLRSLGFNVYEI